MGLCGGSNKTAGLRARGALKAVHGEGVLAVQALPLFAFFGKALKVKYNSLRRFAAAGALEILFCIPPKPVSEQDPPWCYPGGPDRLRRPLRVPVSVESYSHPRFPSPVPHSGGWRDLSSLGANHVYPVHIPSAAPVAPDTKFSIPHLRRPPDLPLASPVPQPLLLQFRAPLPFPQARPQRSPPSACPLLPCLSGKFMLILQVPAQMSLL